MRVVADTNTVVSAFLWGGMPRALFAAARDQKITLLTSHVLIAELEEIITRAKFAKRLTLVRTSIEEIMGDYITLAQLVHPKTVPQVIMSDPDDDHVLACALAAQADLIVSGDTDLLTLQDYQGIRIVDATTAMALIEQQR